MCSMAGWSHLVVGDGKGILLGGKRAHLHRAAGGGGRGLDGAVHLTTRGGCGARAVRVRVSFAVEDFFHRRFTSVVVNSAVLCDKERKESERQFERGKPAISQLSYSIG